VGRYHEPFYVRNVYFYQSLRKKLGSKPKPILLGFGHYSYSVKPLSQPGE